MTSQYYSTISGIQWQYYWLWMLVINWKCMKFHRTIGSLPVFVTGSSKVPFVRNQEQLK